MLSKAACLPVAALAIFLLGGGVAVPSATAADTPVSTALPDLTAIRATIYAERYAEAAAALEDLAKTVQHADLYNLLGFTSRKLGRFEEAEKWYREALYYDPDHRGALEYQGELFISQARIDRARANVGKLEYLCPDGCDELDALKLSIAEAEGTLPKTDLRNAPAKQGTVGSLD